MENEYNKFACDANVEIVRDDNSGKVVGYVLNVSIKCEDTGTDFEFNGDLSLSDDKLIASVPIKPHHNLDLKVITQ